MSGAKYWNSFLEQCCKQQRWKDANIQGFLKEFTSVTWSLSQALYNVAFLEGKEVVPKQENARTQAYV